MSLWPLQQQEAQLQGVSNTALWFQKTGVRPIFTSAVWSSANMIIYTPVLIKKPRSMVALFMNNGAAVSGLGMMALYDDAGGYPGIRRAVSNQQLQAETTHFQPYFTTSYVSSQEGIFLEAGVYWIAGALDNTTGQVLRLVAMTTNGSGIIGGSIFTEASATLDMPAVATPDSTRVAANVPVMLLT